MKKIILSSILLVLLFACKVVVDNTKEEQIIPTVAKKLTFDNYLSVDSNVASNYIWMNKENSGVEPEFFDIYRVDASNIDAVKIYAHVLDIDKNFLKGYFDKTGYKICGFEDNGRHVKEYDVAELKQIEDFEIAYVLDHSGSIGNDRAIQIQNSVDNVNQIKHDNDAFSIIKFDHNVRNVLQLEKDKQIISQELKKEIGLTGFGGATALYDGIVNGIKSLDNNSGKQKILIVISDGYDNASNSKLSSILKKSIDENIAVFTVGFGSRIDVARMEYIANRTGGKFYHIYQTQEFNNVFDAIYKRINNYYVFTYQAVNHGRHDVTITLCKENKKLSDQITYYNDEISDCDIAAYLEIRGVDKQNQEIFVPEVTIWESSTRDFHPLLPYVFFEKNSSEIPKRYYRRNLYNMTNNSLFEYVINNDKTEIYWDVLNIVGERWHLYPTSKIIITGCNDGNTEGSNNLTLSENRAVAVKNYLVSTLGVLAEFIEIKKRNRPEYPSGINAQSAKEENRRVEIDSDNPALLNTFMFRRMTYRSTPPILRTYINILQKDEIVSWEVKIKKEDKILKEVKTFVDKPVKYFDYNINVDVNYNERLGKYLINGADNMTAQLIMNLDSNNTKQCSTQVKNIKIIQNTYEEIKRRCLDEREVDALNLVLFGMGKTTFDDSSLEPYFKDLANKKFDKPIYFDVDGHTDTTGSYSENMNLSSKRAQNVAKKIQELLDKYNINGYINNVRWFGPVVMPQIFKQSTPEGRMYSRTVIVRIYLPIPCDNKGVKE